MAGLDHPANHPLARIGDTRHTSVGDESHRAAFIQATDHLGGRSLLGVLVEAQQVGSHYAGVGQQASCSAGVFAGHQVGDSQRLDGPR